MKTYMLAPTFSDALSNRYSGGPFFSFDQDWLLSTDKFAFAKMMIAMGIWTLRRPCQMIYQMLKSAQSIFSYGRMD